MKKKNIITISIIAVIAILIIWFIGIYNGLVNNQVSVQKQWSNVESVYQRRANLIDNIVETVKGYSAHEAETFLAVTEARSSVISIDPSNSTPEQVEAFMKSQEQITEFTKKQLPQLRLTVEQYPELKANDEFMALIDELAGSENRIQVALRNYNEAASKYNISIRTFPRNIIAGMFNFNEVAFFKADEGANKAPKVNFGK